MKWLIWILYLLFCVYVGWRVWDMKENCCADTSEQIGVVEDARTDDAVASTDNTKTGIVQEAGPILFNWSSDEPILSDRYQKYRDSLAAIISDGRALEIEGQYNDGETNTTSFADLGLARANQIKNRFASVLDGNKINLTSRKINLRDGMKDFPFIAANLKSVRSSDTVREVGNSARLLFPYNSSNLITDRDINDYLGEVADRVKGSKETVRLVGHTDDRGSDESNKTLGLWRAERIRDILTRRGVPARQIRISSQGESDPAESNATEKGRQENRRVELSIQSN